MKIYSLSSRAFPRQSLLRCMCSHAVASASSSAALNPLPALPPLPCSRSDDDDDDLGGHPTDRKARRFVISVSVLALC